jgi:acyl-CoA reductase-like NAD-dependent aldehyde dehydrogenase
MSHMIPKTNKLFIKGEFPRSESGRSLPIHLHKSDKIHSYMCQSSRKDLRMAVEGALAGSQSWSSKTAYNRGQIIYRIAEMLSGRRHDLKAQMISLFGMSDSQFQEQFDLAIECLLYYAGFTDKLSQVLGAINPVSGPFHNFTQPEPVGVIGVVCDLEFRLDDFFHQLAAILSAGNGTVIIFDQPGAALLSDLGEILKTSDLPSGVVNMLSGSIEELAPFLASHMEVDGLVVSSSNPSLITECKALSVENMKRFMLWQAGRPSIKPLMELTESKTVWHPVGL